MEEPAVPEPASPEPVAATNAQVPPDPRAAARTRRVQALAEAVAAAGSERERRRRLDPLRMAAYAGFEPAVAALQGLGLTPPVPEAPQLEPFLQAIPGGKAGQVVAACAVARAVMLVARRAVKEGWLEEDAATLAIEAAEAWLDSPSSEGELATRDAAELAQEVHEQKLNAVRLFGQPGDAVLEIGYATRAAELAARAAYAPSEADARAELLAQVHPASAALINPALKSDSPERWVATQMVQQEWILPAIRAALIEWALRPRGA